MDQFLIEKKIEALLFYKNEPLEIKKIAKILEIGEKETKEAVRNLSESFKNRGICLIETENEIALATAPEMKDFIETVAKEEMSKEIGRAGLETLSIVLYNGPVSRREIDHIRGVNSTFILRNLCVRGLVEKEPDPEDQRILKYKGSLSLLAHLGLTKTGDLPEYSSLKKELEETIDNGEQD